MENQSRWFDIHEIEPDIFLIREPGHVQNYLIKGEKKAVLVDTGMGFCDLAPVIERLITTPLMVVNTHWHFDHIGGNAEFDVIGISEIEADMLLKPISDASRISDYIQSCLDQGVPLPLDFEPEKYLIKNSKAAFSIKDKDTFDLGGRILKAIATPGHTHGSLSFLDSETKSLFCGDFLYDGTLYAQFTDSNLEDYIQSLKKIKRLDRTITSLYGAHNTPRMDTTMVERVLKVMEKINKKEVQGHSVLDWGTPIDFFSLDGIDILVKQAGTEGVRLLD